ncbi:DUF4974 domain-containing protein [Acinetobacter qingfengensis]|uniref:FecR protein domain-containing protein n=1 Tax=Acinetobacter qingfengensis TaxID=1262585 RepID=A0A1E7R566_9GAMM|nr:FecR domain-containing protein [Acinetobacter qingfengensis]KAA8732463.1 DUF4974 domain-containing protein [Acinetobacter qingfengensis]OEY94458.1 hypothetical protein BJI46_03705 [Acinetobacter qingfengensis]
MPRQDDQKQLKTQKQVQQALIPFEDALIAQLPKPEEIIQAALQRQQKQRRRQKNILSLLFLATLGGIWWWNPVYDQHYLSTGIGEQKDYILSDGSQIKLNTATQLQIAYHLRSRNIQLEHGEATFHVKHAFWHAWLPWAERRFEVRSGNIRIEDIGTVFNVRQFTADHTQVAVLQGQVQVWSADQQQTMLLKTGESLMTSIGQLNTLQQSVDVQQLIAWQKGHYYFNNQSLAEVLAELNRYGELPVKIQQGQLGQLRISGQANLAHRMQLIHALPTFSAVSIVQDEQGIFWIKAKK